MQLIGPGPVHQGWLYCPISGPVCHYKLIGKGAYGVSLRVNARFRTSISPDSVVLNQNIQSWVQVLLEACNLTHYTGLQGHYIVRSENCSWLSFWRWLPVWCLEGLTWNQGAPARSHGTDVSSRDQRTQPQGSGSWSQESGRLLSGVSNRTPVPRPEVSHAAGRCN